ncbi:MAG: tryptophan synthase subunit alpha [Ignavibacteriales bacterium]|nr:tryptophan synthase subunit alpha [Ignavibacteriales bacterium]
MIKLSEYIKSINDKKEKALSIFLTVGFPNKNNFVDLAIKVLDSGADLIELGIPFSDPLADGVIIQQSSHLAIENGINLETVLEFTNKINVRTSKPIILMGYANPILNYGVKNFLKDAQNSGASGLIVPDIPLEEMDSFFENNRSDLDIILLTTPTSSDERIEMIDEKSSGFVYCVSVSGTTGIRKNFSEETLNSLKRTYSLVSKNKMLIGFGISTPENIKEITPYCDGVIVGSAIIKQLMNDNKSYDKTLTLIKELKQSCTINY